MNWWAMMHSEPVNATICKTLTLKVALKSVISTACVVSKIGT